MLWETLQCWQGDLFLVWGIEFSTSREALLQLLRSIPEDYKVPSISLVPSTIWGVSIWIVTCLGHILGSLMAPRAHFSHSAKMPLLLQPCFHIQKRQSQNLQQLTACPTYCNTVCWFPKGCKRSEIPSNGEKNQNILLSHAVIGCQEASCCGHSQVESD